MSRTGANRRAGVRLTVERLERRDVPSGIAVQPFKLPAGTNFPDHLTLGGDGNVWFSCDLANLVGSITPAGSVTVFNTSSVSAHGLDGLTRGRDNNIWFSEFYGKVGKITPTGQITQYRLKHHGEPESIAAGPDGKLWITTFDNYVGRVTRSGAVIWFRHGGEGLGKIVSFHGALYFQEYDIIGRIATDGVFTGKFRMPHHGHVGDLAVGPDGKLWFTEQTGSAVDYVGSLTAAGRIQEYPVPATNGGVGHLTAAGDGNIYVRDGDDLMGLHPDGTVFASQDLGFIAGNGPVVQGGDGNVWYAEGLRDKIGVARVAG
jgi:virginiamycin B lyase